MKIKKMSYKTFVRTCKICGEETPTSNDVIWHQIIHAYEEK